MLTSDMSIWYLLMMVLLLLLSLKAVVWVVADGPSLGARPHHTGQSEVY